MSVLAGNSGNSFRAAGFDRLTGDWRYWDRDPRTDWIWDARRLASRAWDLYRNDPVLAALVHAKIGVTHGACGLKFRSLYGEGETTSALRQGIEDVIVSASAGTQLDAGGLLSRHELEESMDLMATVSGECFAVRLFLPNRPGARYATCWRLVRPERVRNPPDRSDDETLYQGIELDPATGAPLGIHIGPPAFAPTTSGTPDEWSYVSWYADDGARNVLHRIGLRLPGSYRGVSMLAQNMFQAKQTHELMNAYLVAKRIQASMPVFIKCDDPYEAAKNDRHGVVFGPNTPIEAGKTYYIGRDSEISFPPMQFQGQDMREMLDTCYRNQFAAWNMPIDVVLCDLGKTNMAASRSAWLQYYRQGERWQDDHIEQVTGPLNESILRESVARGELALSDADWHANLKGRYVRPPRAMPDPLKEAMAVQLWLQLGRDYTSLYAESGQDFQESVRQRAEDERLIEAEGVEVDLTGAGPPAPEAADEPQQPSKNSDTPANAE